MKSTIKNVELFRDVFVSKNFEVDKKEGKEVVVFFSLLLLVLPIITLLLLLFFELK